MLKSALLLQAIGAMALMADLFQLAGYRPVIERRLLWMANRLQRRHIQNSQDLNNPETIIGMLPQILVILIAVIWSSNSAQITTTALVVTKVGTYILGLAYLLAVGLVAALHLFFEIGRNSKTGFIGAWGAAFIVISSWIQWLCTP